MIILGASAWHTILHKMMVARIVLRTILRELKFLQQLNNHQKTFKELQTKRLQK